VGIQEPSPAVPRARAAHHASKAWKSARYALRVALARASAAYAFARATRTSSASGLANGVETSARVTSGAGVGAKRRSDVPDAEADLLHARESSTASCFRELCRATQRGRPARPRRGGVDFILQRGRDVLHLHLVGTEPLFKVALYMGGVEVATGIDVHHEKRS
jgi:hypothetical protein